MINCNASGSEGGAGRWQRRNVWHSTVDIV